MTNFQKFLKLCYNALGKKAVSINQFKLLKKKQLPKSLARYTKDDKQTKNLHTIWHWATLEKLAPQKKVRNDKYIETAATALNCCDYWHQAKVSPGI